MLQPKVASQDQLISIESIKKRSLETGKQSTHRDVEVLELFWGKN